MKRLYFILIMGLMLQISCFAQHFPIYSQYMMNGLTINPAYAGSREVLSATLLYRQQWVGFEGAPAIFSFGAHMPFRNQRVSLGVLALNESVGIEKNTALYGNYSYRIQLGRGKIALGLKAGFNVVKELNSKITLHDPSGDAAFENMKEIAFMPNFGFGVYYSAPAYFIGASIPSLLTYSSNSESLNMGIKNYNVLLTGGYLHKLNDQFKIKPSTLVKYQYGSSPQVDLNLNFIFLKDDILWIGPSYRINEALVGLVEIQVSRKFRLGYSYDIPLGVLRKYKSGSHEIMLRYEWRDKINTLNPLYF